MGREFRDLSQSVLMRINIKAMNVNGIRGFHSPFKLEAFQSLASKAKE